MNALIEYHPFDDDPPDDDEYGLKDTCDTGGQDCLYRCKAKFKGHIECHDIFSCANDISEHLKHIHKTTKWLVDKYIKIQI